MRRLVDITGPSFGPAAGGKPRQLVVLLHGYGADGNDLLGLAPHWARLLPEAEFVAPHAPFPCEAAPFGRQWFGFEGRSEDMILAETRTAAGFLDAFLDAERDRRGLRDNRIALVGFSQGTMMSLHVAPRRPQPVAAVVGYSGALIAPQTLAAEIRSPPRILLVHGTSDPVVPYASLDLAAQTLRASGCEVTTESRRGLAHAIDEEGLALGGQFLVTSFTPTSA